MKTLNNEQWREMQERIAANKEDQESLAKIYASITLVVIAIGMIVIAFLIN